MKQIMCANRRRLGIIYEEIAAGHLTQSGYEIRARNFRAGNKEIDIIATKDGELVFVEVKGGRSKEFGELVYKVDRHKQEALIAAAQAYIQQSHIDYRGYRFDVVIVDDAGEQPRVEHVENAFSL